MSGGQHIVEYEVRPYYTFMATMDQVMRGDAAAQWVSNDKDLLQVTRWRMQHKIRLIDVWQSVDEGLGDADVQLLKAYQWYMQRGLELLANS